MPKRKRGSNASDALDASVEKLVLDQCALFALQRVVSAVQDREVSSQDVKIARDLPLSAYPTEMPALASVHCVSKEKRTK